MEFVLPDFAFAPKEFVHYLNFYHYGAATMITVVALLLFILAIVVRKKMVLSALIFLFVFLFPMPAMIGAYLFIEKANRQLDVTDFETKRLQFIKGIVVKGTMTNNGQDTIKKEFFKVKLVKKDSFWPMEILNYYKPVYEGIFVETKTLAPNENEKFDLLVDTTKIKNLDNLRIYLVYKAF